MKARNINRNLIILGILFIPSLVTWILVYPGYFQTDHQTTIMSIVNGEPSEWHSLIWAYLFFPILFFPKTYAYYGIIQNFIFALCITFGISRLQRCGFIKHPYILAFVIAFWPTFLLYNQLYSSDICFAFILFPLVALYIEYIKKPYQDKKFYIWLAIFTACACLLRKNAMAVPLLSTIIILFIKIPKKKIIIINLSSIALAFVCSFSLSLVVNAKKSPSQEMLSVPSQQIAATYYYGGDIPQSCRNFFEQYKSEEEWIKAYDEMAHCADFSKDKMELSFEFIKNWLITGLHNPQTYIDAYTHLECGFWEWGMKGFYGASYPPDVGLKLDFDQYDEFTTDNIKNSVFNEEQTNNYLKQFHVQHSNRWNKAKTLYTEFRDSTLSTSSFLITNIFFNRALPFWTLLISLLISIWAKKTKQYLFIASPVIAIMLTFLCFAPQALMRYSVMMYYAIPLILIWIGKTFWAQFCCSVNNSKKMNKNIQVN